MSGSRFILISILATALNAHVFAQAKSAIQFWDTTGANATGKIGWSGDQTTGKVFVQTPNTADAVTIDNSGNTAVKGSVTATSFSGSGANLTDLDASLIKSGLIDTARMPVTVKDLAVDGKLSATNITPGSNGQVLTTNNSVSTWTTPASAPVSSVTAGNGITIPNSTGAVTVSANFTTNGGNNGTATTVARGDHNHNSTYFTQDQINASFISSCSYYMYSSSSSYYVSGFSSGATVSAGSITMKTPSAGYILLTATASVSFINSSTGYVIVGGIVDQNNNNYSGVGIEPNISVIGDYNKQYPWAQTRAYVIPSAGTYTYTLKFSNNTSAEQRLWSPMMTAIFVQNKLPEY